MALAAALTEAVPVSDGEGEREGVEVGFAELEALGGSEIVAGSDGEIEPPGDADVVPEAGAEANAEAVGTEARALSDKTDARVDGDFVSDAIDELDGRADGEFDALALSVTEHVAGTAWPLPAQHGHGTGADEFAGQKKPVGHVRGDVVPGDAQKEPGGQPRQVDAPASGAYDPGAHLEQGRMQYWNTTEPSDPLPPFTGPTAPPPRRNVAACVNARDALTRDEPPPPPAP